LWPVLLSTLPSYGYYDGLCYQGSLVVIATRTPEVFQSVDISYLFFLVCFRFLPWDCAFVLLSTVQPTKYMHKFTYVFT